MINSHLKMREKMNNISQKITVLTVQERLKNIRTVMQKQSLDAIIIPTGDPHISEYPSKYWSTREWASGFTGSAGTVVITKNCALLWTDGRYYIQAEQQLTGSGIGLQRASDPNCPKIEKWLLNNLENGSRVNCDGRQISADAANKIRSILKKENKELILDNSPIDEIWENRPSLPNSKAFVHNLPFCGLSVSEKLKLIRTEMEKKDATHYLVSSLDAVAWLSNIRGADIPWTPLILAYILVEMDDVTCFIDNEKCPASVKKHFSDNGIIIRPYNAIRDEIINIDADSVLILDPKRTSAWLYDAISDKCQISEINDPIQSIKAVKHESELINLRKCIDRDCIAVNNVLNWIDKCIKEKTEITEISISKQLEYFRTKDDRYIGASFETIAAYGEHAALMHYAVSAESDVKIENSGFLLIDTGGQYLDGTTDITRTIACGNLSEEQRRDYTLVLKAHIALSRAVFIEGTCGSHLDILARGILAREGLNYRCGTGHSIGYCLNVHEGPHGITNGSNMIALKPGMIVTNEPGIYREGSHGIRIENTMLVCEHNETEFGKFYAFEVLSYCLIDITPVIESMLTNEETEWLENYKKETIKRISS